MNKKDYINNYTFQEIGRYCSGRTIPLFRARQIVEWIYKKSVTEWNEMTTLSKDLRKNLEQTFLLSSLRLKKSLESSRKDSIKYLFQTDDGYVIETVLIFHNTRRTICLSTQVGCKYMCLFCASGRGGLKRNLSCAEIVDQILLVQQHSGAPITNVVYMGMGEPFDNYDNTIKSITKLTSEYGFGLSARRITVSTVGLIPEIERFSKEGFSQIKLSISLHAADEAKRKALMPVSKKYSLKDLITCLNHVRKKFKRTITLEYIVIKNFNDSKEDIHNLSNIARELKAKVNLIGYNSVLNATFKVSTKQDIDVFREKLENKGVRTTIRYSAGDDIRAACGQLRLQYKN